MKEQEIKQRQDVEDREIERRWLRYMVRVIIPYSAGLCGIILFTWCPRPPRHLAEEQEEDKGQEVAECQCEKSPARR